MARIYFTSKPETIQAPKWVTKDYSGRSQGRMIVLGYYGLNPEKFSLNRNKKHIDKLHTWAIQCDCGICETRTSHDLQRELQGKNGNVSMCKKCYSKYKAQ